MKEETTNINRDELQKVKSVTALIFQNADIKTKFKIKPSYHYSQEMAELMEKIINDKFILLQTMDDAHFSVFYKGKAYDIEDSYFIFSGSLDDCLGKIAQDTYSNQDGSKTYLFNL